MLPRAERGRRSRELVGASSTADSILKIYRASIGDAPSKMLTRAVAQKLVADFHKPPRGHPDMDDEGDAMQLTPSSRGAGTMFARAS